MSCPETRVNVGLVDEVPWFTGNDLAGVFSGLMSAAGGIGGFGGDYGNGAPISIPVPDIDVGTVNLKNPNKPTIRSATVSPPSISTSLQLGTVSPLDIGEGYPTFDEPDPVFRYPTAVAPFTEPLPDEVILQNLSVRLPDEPDSDIPPVPSLRELVLPEPVEIEIEEFKGSDPGKPEAPPDVSFNYQEDLYSSTLLSQLNESLLEHVRSLKVTGLNPAIEQQIWDRARERTRAATQAAIRLVRRMAASAGWEQPTGDVYDAEQRAIQSAAQEEIAESRNIAIEQAKLELQNFQFAFTQAIALEGQLINSHNQKATRLLEASKYAVQAAIELYNVKAAYFGQGVELFKAHAMIYEARIRGALAKAEVYKTQLEGQKLVGDINLQDLEVYKTIIETIFKQYELYKTKLEGVNILLEQDGLRLEQFKTQITAFSEKVKAKSLEYEGYKSALSGEQIKAGIYATKAEAFGKRVEAFKAVVDAKTKEFDADVRMNQDNPIEVYKAELEGLKSLVEAEGIRVNAINEYNRTLADVYASEAGAASADVQGQAAVVSARASAAGSAANAATAAAKAQADAAIKGMELSARATEAEAQIRAQLAAAQMSAFNFSLGSSTSNVNSASNTFVGSASISAGTTTSYSGTCD